MRWIGPIRVEKVNGANIISQNESKRPKNEPEPAIKIEPIMPVVEPILPKIEPILPKIEPIERGVPGTFFEHSPERLILWTLEDGPRMRDNLIRLVSATMPRAEAEKLLDKMLKSGVIAATRSGRVSIVEAR